MKLIGIYKIINPKGAIYIGQSVDIISRWNKYKGMYKSSQTKLINSIKKYGWNKHDSSILVLCEESKLNELEKYFSELYSSLDPNTGLNIRECGGSRGRHSEETKRKMSKANIGHIHSEATKEKIRAKRKHQIFSEESKQKMRGRTPWNKGIPLPEHIKRRLSELNKGKIGKYSPSSKEVRQLDLNGNIIKTWDNAREVQRELCYSCSTINRAARGERDTAYGFKWEYNT